MSSEVTVREIRFVSAFPWLKLGRAWGCALSLQQMAIACTAALLLTLADTFLLPETSPRLAAGDVAWFESTLATAQALAGPMGDIVQPARSCLAGGAGWWRQGLLAALAFAVWSIAGPTLARLTAIQFGRDENPELREAVQFALPRAAAVCGAPAIPFGFAALLCVVIAALALPGWIPALGQFWLILLSPVLFVLGAMVAFVALSVPVLWPLMVAAVSVDDGDAFDAFSRAFSLAMSRFWSLFSLAVLSGLHLLLALVLLTALARATTVSAAWSADWTTGQYSVTTVASWVAWWAAIGVRGVMASLFWTLATIVYLFLREAVDGVPPHRLAGVDDSTPRNDPYPVVGLAAVQPPAESGSSSTVETPQED